MNPEEYERLERVEGEHWFYAGKRRIVLESLRRLGALGAGKVLVDCGAGTGFFAREAGRECSVIAVDDHEESLAIARKYLGDDHVRKGSCTALPLADASADIATALDVIEHIPDDAAAVGEMFRILRPGGTLIVTVPAFQSLWSDWDVALHHQRRYRRKPLRDLLSARGFEVLRCEYVNVLAFPAVWILRKWRTWFPGREPGATLRAEERIPPAWLNGLLMAAFVRPALQTAVSFPFGVGLLAVARKPSNP